MAEEEEVLQLEPLVIVEDGDLAEGEPTSSSDVASLSCAAASRPEGSTGEDENHEDEAGETNSGEESVVSTEEKLSREDKPNDGQNRDNSEKQGSTKGAEKPSDIEEGKLTQNVDRERLKASEEQVEGATGKEDGSKKAHQLTPDFPEALYELLCTFQEGRRLNDQRCSFRLEGGMRRRRCHSEPNAIKPANRVVFSSMTSLQKEEFFDLVATAQARRINDQRAQLGRSSPPKAKCRSFRGSIKQLSFVKKPAPVPVPKEDLYDMILTTQAQGRLEDQRSRAPGPMDDEDFFSLLLRVQGGRMDEQRTELPRLLKT